MSDTLEEVILWQHDETGRTCWSKESPGLRWYRVETPRLCYFHKAAAVIRERDERIVELERSLHDAQSAIRQLEGARDE